MVLPGRHTAPTWVVVGITVVGALNWLMVGLAGIDLVAAIFGTMSPWSRVVYIVVGLAGFALLVLAATRLTTVRKVGMPDTLS